MKKMFFLILIMIVFYLAINIFNKTNANTESYNHLEVSFNDNIVTVFNKNTGTFYIHKLSNNNEMWNALTDVSQKKLAIQLNSTGNEISIRK